MYVILKKSGSDSDNVWQFYTENGVLYTASTITDAATKIEELAKTTPVLALRLMQQIEFDMDITVPEESTPEPTEPEEPTEP